MKASAIVRIVLYTLLFLVLLGILLGGIFIGEFMSLFSSWSPSGEYDIVERSVSAEEFTNLEIEWAAGSIKVVTGDTDQITVKETKDSNNPYTLVTVSGDDTLTIQYGSNPSIHLGSLSGKDLVITVPKNWNCKELSIDGAALDIEISGLTVESIDLDGAATELSFAGKLGELECDGAAAELTLNCTNSPDRISIDGAACSLNLTLPADCGFIVDADGLAIDFRSGCDYTQNDGSYICGNGHCKIRVSGLGCQVSVDQSEVCNHLWNEGVVQTVPGGGHEELLYTCTVCGETKSEIYVGSTNFSIRYANSFTEDMLLEPPMASYAADTNVTIKTDILTDVDLELYVDGVFICKQREVLTDEIHCWEFTFTMPDHDVTIQLKTSDGT